MSQPVQYPGHVGLAEPSSSNWQIRIEALRAAATLVASKPLWMGEYDAGEGVKAHRIEKEHDAALALAKRFERYLESGE